MSSKTFLLFGFLVTVLLIASEVAARDLAETSTQKVNEEAKQPDGFTLPPGLIPRITPRPGRAHRGFSTDCSRRGCCLTIKNRCFKCCS